MKHTAIYLFATPLLCVAAITAQTTSPLDMATAQEKHLRNAHQLTFGGQNAEAYFSSDGKS